MKKAKVILHKIFNPPIAVLVIVPLISFAGLICVFVFDHNESATAYAFYALSAYSLAVLIIDSIKRIPKIKIKVRSYIDKKSKSVKFINDYLTDVRFKGMFNLYFDAIFDALYTSFRLIIGIIYSSIWSITLAVYHLFLGLLRIYLATSLRKEKTLAENTLFEYNCSYNVARLIFLLYLPMGGIIALMIWTDSGFVFPGYVIYLSALFTFYNAVSAVVNLVKFKNVGSPILSSAKAINLIVAMTSVLGLQTAMITAFSENQDSFRQTINAVTGGAITIAVISIAVYIIANARKNIKAISEKTGGHEYEQIGE